MTGPENGAAPTDQVGAARHSTSTVEDDTCVTVRPPDIALALSGFSHEKDTAPKPWPTTWSQLVEFLRHPRAAACTATSCAGGKKCREKFGPAWSPASYPPGGERVDDDVDALAALVLDLDHLTEAQRVAALTRLEPYRCVAHSSHSDGNPRAAPEGKPDALRCIRAVVALTRPVLAAEWERFWAAAVAYLVVPVDPVTKNLSRIYFMPSRPADAFYFFATSDSVVPLDVDAILEAAPPPAPERPKVDPAAPRKEYPPASPELLEDARARLERHGPSRRGQGGDAHAYQVGAILLNDYALSAEEAWPLAVRWNTLPGNTWTDEKLALKLRNGANYAKGAYGEERDKFERARALRAALALPAVHCGQPRPSITVRATARSGTIDQAEVALAAVGDVYSRARRLVRVVRDRTENRGLRYADGTPVIAAIDHDNLLEHLDRAANWYAAGSEGERKVAAPAWVASMLTSRQEWPALPPLDGIVEAPILRPDGTVHDAPGYDPASRLIYDPCGEQFPPVPASPTRDDARRALEELVEPMCNVPWVAESDRAAWASMVLTLAGRSAIDGCTPLYLVRAPVPGAGKGLATDTAALIATGRAAPKRPPTTSEDELRKALLAYALEAPALVVLDNVDGEIGSPTLAMVLTAGTISDRILGVSESRTVPVRFVLAATGNNITLRGDLGRRVMPIDIDPRVEHPQDRTGFRYPNLLDHVRRERPRLLVAALTILRAHAVAGRPGHGGARLGSYESWDDVARSAVIWAGDVDPLAGAARIREEGDSDLEALRTLLVAWRDVYGDRWVTLGEVADDVRHAAGGDKAAFRDALAVYGTKGGQLETSALGYGLRRLKGRIAGGLAIGSGEKTKRGVLWRVADGR